MRIALLGLCVVLAGWAGGCDRLGLGDDDSPTGPTGPPPTGSALVYSPIGASDVIGFGSSQVCLPFENCNGMGYVFAAARQLRSQGFTVTVAPRGIPTAVISPRFQALGRQYGREILGNFLEQLAPFLAADTSLVTIFAGGNDVNVVTAALGGGAGGSNPNAYIDQQVQAFGEDYAALLAEVRRRAPAARIIALNLPNLGALPNLAGAPPAQRRAAQRIAVGMTTTVVNRIASQNARVVDLMCDGRLLQPANLAPDGFHPNDAGYAIMAEAVVSAVTSAAYPAPATSCPQMTLIP
jgi:lysophospholipase L1-like esterase